jgi:hypothetical protein
MKMKGPRKKEDRRERCLLRETNGAKIIEMKERTKDCKREQGGVIEDDNLGEKSG